MCTKSHKSFIHGIAEWSDQIHSMRALQYLVCVSTLQGSA